MIDVISDEDMQYIRGSPGSIGVFNYHFRFTWSRLSARDNMKRNFDESMPFRTPTIAGGLFIVDRKFFYDQGSYDQGLCNIKFEASSKFVYSSRVYFTGMDIWGAENIEISLRVIGFSVS